MRVKKQLDALDSRMEIAVEDYDEARVGYLEATRKVAENKSTLRRLNGRIGVLQSSLDARAQSMYRNGPLGTVDVLFGTTTFEDFTQTWDLLTRWNEEESAALAELRASRKESLRVESDLEASQSQARGHLKVVTDRKRTITVDLAKRAAMLAGLESEIAALRAQERARAMAAARRTRPSRSGGWDWGSPSKSPRSGVVTIARRYLGRPYHWAATGPGSFDCSGFTMFVYAQVGVRLPHSSRAQLSAGARVSRANLQAGDLVFFGRPIHHVGIYVGGGMFIHSPRTGDVVSVDPLLRDFSGACRP
ncbi:MAG: NlpC/P60 family protein [Coriobacteriia bacterium]|nr:NlpC/P60 family protein [Coriobacteriia bacterium]